MQITIITKICTLRIKCHNNDLHSSTVHTYGCQPTVKVSRDRPRWPKGFRVV